MEPLIEIQDRLKNYPLIKFIADENSIILYPTSESGFIVEFHVSGGREFTVYYEGWHEQFDDVEKALSCFAFGLSKSCRLKTVSRGGKPYRWIVQSCKDGKWADDSETGLLVFSFWRRPEINFFQNELIDQ